LADASSGGVWSSGSPSVATISTTGLVTAVASGTDEIYYSISNSCGTVTDSIAVTVTVGASAGTISGASGVCQGASTTLSDGVAGGLWSVSNGRASVSGGVVIGISTGLDTVKYTVTNICGTATTTKPISVNAAPYAGSISGYTSVCAGSSITLSESVAGGTWSSGNSSVATVSGGGVTGVAVGTATISYSVSNSCGTRSATHTVTVVPTDECNTMVNNAANGINGIRVYPNPASDILNIEAPVKVNVSVLGMDGKVLITQHDVTNIDISRLANALYMIMIYDENGLLLKIAKFTKTE